MDLKDHQKLVRERFEAMFHAAGIAADDQGVKMHNIRSSINHLIHVMKKAVPDATPSEVAHSRDGDQAFQAIVITDSR